MNYSPLPLAVASQKTPTNFRRLTRGVEQPKLKGCGFAGGPNS